MSDGSGIHASYGEAFARFAGGLGAAEHAARAAAFEEFVRHGLPDDSSERWHYTNLRALPARPVHLATAPEATDLSAWRLDDCEEQLWLNGRPLAVASIEAAPLPALDAHAGLAGLHRAFALPGLQLHLGRGERRARPVHALCISGAREDGEMHHLAHRIVLDANAEAVVILQQIGLDGAARLATQSLAVTLGAGARLTLVRLQAESRATTQWLQMEASVARDAQLAVVNVDLGGGLIRNDWRVKLADTGAQAELAGLFAADARVHLDNQYEIDHAAPRGTSRQHFRGLGFGTSKAILNGRVVVQRGAQKTDSEQRIANLMFAKGAEIDAKPELEIYADDVKCAHGASCGQLDETAVFYLRTRGVPEAEARALLTYSFVDEVLRRIPHAGLRRRIAQRITARLGANLDFDISDALAGAAA